ncbi:hypothetical protein RHGRI_004254 [Rhododendron griersonianum]|uniref:Uncharacterized protein n=1 Tax=Rhododendron griersonianum TaxID=479676 RepID=A0AAV6L959_9ERIC|nr:hypothetical protein RHGRI_004254 [Rhododendron griersonianum]
MQSYTIWHEHGEPRESNDVRRHEMRDGDLGGIDALVEDRIRGEPIDTTQHHEEIQNFDKLLNDAQREIYPGSKDYNLLKFVIEIFCFTLLLIRISFKLCCLFIVDHHAKKSRGEKVPTKKKQGKVMLQPNFLATHYKTHYEKIRDEQIKRNNEVLESLGVKKIATSMMGSARLQCANDNGKRGRADQVDDPNYILSNDEDGHGYDSESDDSFEQEDLEIPPGGLPAQSHTEPQCGVTLICDRVTRSTPHPSLESQASLPPIAQPQNEVLPENNGGDQGKMQLPTAAAAALLCKAYCCCCFVRPAAVLLLFCYPILLTYQLIRKHAAQLASRIGVEVRTHVIDLGVPRWKAVDESVKAPILQRIMDKFDLQGDPIDVEKAVATQCGRRLSNHNFVLHKKYKKLKETRGEEYARNNPPAGINPEQWTSLGTKKWTVKKWLERSEKNTKNRFDFLPLSMAAFDAAFLPSFLPLCLLLLILGALCSAS